MKKEFKFILKYLKEHRLKLILACIIIFVSSILGLTYGYFNGKAISEITKLNLKLSIIYFALYFFVSMYMSIL